MSELTTLVLSAKHGETGHFRVMAGDQSRRASIARRVGEEALVGPLAPRFAGAPSHAMRRLAFHDPRSGLLCFGSSYRWIKSLFPFYRLVELTTRTVARTTFVRGDISDSMKRFLGKREIVYVPQEWGPTPTWARDNVAHVLGVSSGRVQLVAHDTLVEDMATLLSAEWRTADRWLESHRGPGLPADFPQDGDKTYCVLPVMVVADSVRTTYRFTFAVNTSASTDDVDWASARVLAQLALVTLGGLSHPGASSEGESLDFGTGSVIAGIVWRDERALELFRLLGGRRNAHIQWEVSTNWARKPNHQGVLISGRSTGAVSKRGNRYTFDGVVIEDGFLGGPAYVGGVAVVLSKENAYEIGQENVIDSWNGLLFDFDAFSLRSLGMTTAGAATPDSAIRGVSGSFVYSWDGLERRLPEDFNHRMLGVDEDLGSIDHELRPTIHVGSTTVSSLSFRQAVTQARGYVAQGTMSPVRLVDRSPLVDGVLGSRTVFVIVRRKTRLNVKFGPNLGNLSPALAEDVRNGMADLSTVWFLDEGSPAYPISHHTAAITLGLNGFGSSLEPSYTLRWSPVWVDDLVYDHPGEWLATSRTMAAVFADSVLPGPQVGRAVASLLGYWRLFTTRWEEGGGAQRVPKASLPVQE